MTLPDPLGYIAKGPGHIKKYSRQEPILVEEHPFNRKGDYHNLDGLLLILSTTNLKFSPFPDTET